MEHADVVAEHEIAAPRTSVEKVRDLIAQLGSYQADDPDTAAKLALLGGLLPMLLPALPQDPAELDEVLLLGAKWALNLRSDHAWQPEQLDELYGLGEHQGDEPEAA